MPPRLLTGFGETKSLTAWTRDSRCSVSVTVLHHRLKSGWPVERAIATPQQRHWTDAEDEVVRQYAVGRNGAWGECAKILGRSVVSIRSRAARIGVERPLADVSEDAIRLLHSQGFLNREIGERLGVTDECIRRWLNLLKLPMNKRDEKKRQATQERNLLAKYGVRNPNQAHKVRMRRLRQAAFTVQSKDLSSKLHSAAREAKCPA